MIQTTAGLAILPLVGTSSSAIAADAPKLDPNDAQAKALSYVHDASTVKSPARTSDKQICRTCIQYTADAKADWGPCNIFPGKGVAAKGWCAAYAPKPGA